MDILRQLLLVVHLVACAALLGGLLGQLKATQKAVHVSTIWGARIAFLAGLALVGVIEGNDGHPDHAKIAVKMVIGFVVLGLLEARRKKGLTDVLFYSALGLSIINVGVAVLWKSAHHF